MEAGAIDIIVMKCLDRWFRNVKDYYKVQDILDAHGVGWECSQDMYDTTTAISRLHLHIRIAIAEEESDRTGERIRYVFRGKKERREALSGALPVGCESKGKHIVVNEAEAPIARFMFQYVQEGNSAFSVPLALQERFGYAISYNRVFAALCNRIYIGVWHGIPGYCPEIVPTDVFEQVQDVVNGRVRFRSSPAGRVYLFSGLCTVPFAGGCSRAIPDRETRKANTSPRSIGARGTESSPLRINVPSGGRYTRAGSKTICCAICRV